MRAVVASTLLTACAGLSCILPASADDPVLSPPFPSDSMPQPSFEAPSPMTQEYTPAVPQYESSPSMRYARPPVSQDYGYDQMPRPSYEDVASGYSAPSHSLVPSALSAGPRFIGLGNYGGAYAGGTHIRYPYYNYRSPWTYGGPASINHTIVW